MHKSSLQADLAKYYLSKLSDSLLVVGQFQ